MQLCVEKEYIIGITSYLTHCQATLFSQKGLMVYDLQHCMWHNVCLALITRRDSIPQSCFVEWSLKSDHITRCDQTQQ